MRQFRSVVSILSVGTLTRNPDGEKIEMWPRGAGSLSVMSADCDGGGNEFCLRPTWSYFTFTITFEGGVAAPFL